MIDCLKARFKEIYGQEPRLMVKAPGRINLLGEHTDYNEGFVLPMGINRYSVMLSSPRKDNTISIYARNYERGVSFSLDDIAYDNEDKWSNYPRGVINVLQNKGHKICGMDILLWGDIPVGAGLSSSASVEAAAVLTVNAWGDLNISSLDMIKFARQAENEFVGVNCGIMDQFAIILSKCNEALLLDCRSLEYEYISLKEAHFVICDTKIKRELSNSAYNQRRRECEEGVRIIKRWLPKAGSLRDIELKHFMEYKDAISLPVRNRVEHIIRENERVIKAAKYLKEGRLKEFGRLMSASHESLKNLYEVSCDELDLIVETAGKIKGVLGARMTGAGFGGCVIALIEKENIDEFKKVITTRYKKDKGEEPGLYVVESSDGAQASYLP